MKLNRLIIFMLVGLFLINFVNAVSLEPIKLGDDIQIWQTCNNCTYCNFTSVKYPNGTEFMNDLSATQRNSYFYYDIAGGNITEIGTYIYTYDCGNALESKTGSIEIPVTPTGRIFSAGQGIVSVGILIASLVLGFLFLVVGFKISENPNFIPIAFVMIVLGLLMGIYSLHLSYAFTSDIISYESLTPVTEVMYVSILWLLVGLVVISMAMMLIAFIKEILKINKTKSFGDDFNPITNTYDY